MSSRVFQSVEVSFRLPPGTQDGLLDPWIALLADDAGDFPITSRLPVDPVLPSHDWLMQVLALVGVLLHALRVPAFDGIEIESCDPSARGGERWVARISSAALGLSPRVFVGVIRAALRLSAWVIGRDVKSAEVREEFFGEIDQAVLKPLQKHVRTGKSTYEVIRAARQLDIPCLPLPPSFYQLGWGAKGRRMDRSNIEGDSILGFRWAMDKAQTAAILDRAGLPGPRHYLVGSLEQAQAAFRRLGGGPVVVKPTDLERSEGVVIDITLDNLPRAFQFANERSRRDRVLVEKQAPGVCHRIFIAGGEMLFANMRRPIGVHGDGQKTVSTLVAELCAEEGIRPPWKRSAIRSLDRFALVTLRRQGLEPGSVPADGQFVALRPIQATAWGGLFDDVTDQIHPANVRIAEAAAKMLGLGVAGVDIISPDIARPWYENGAIINEVNYAPVLGGSDLSRKYLGKYLERLVPQGGRIPIEVIVGGADAWNLARERWQALRDSGACAYLTQDAETFGPDGESCHLTVADLRSRVQAVLMRRDAETLVIAVQSTEMLAQPLPVDRVSALRIVDHELYLDRERTQKVSEAEVAAVIEACQALFERTVD